MLDDLSTLCTHPPQRTNVLGGEAVRRVSVRLPRVHLADKQLTRATESILKDEGNNEIKQTDPNYVVLAHTCTILRSINYHRKSVSLLVDPWCRSRCHKRGMRMIYMPGLTAYTHMKYPIVPVDRLAKS